VSARCAARIECQQRQSREALSAIYDRGVARDIFIGVVGGLITSVILAAWGVITGHWPLVVQRNHGSELGAAWDVSKFGLAVAVGVFLAYAAVEALRHPERFNLGDNKAAKIGSPVSVMVIGTLLLIYGGWNLWVVFTDPTGTPWINRFWSASP
jgi:hypothetical protein